MPVKDLSRYPKNWPAIRRAIRARADDCCEQCGVNNHAWRNNATGQWTGDAGLAEAWKLDGDKITRIVLTVAHLDHQPENCDPSNLRALCQRCHLAYDSTHHARTRRKPRSIQRHYRQPALFDWQEDGIDPSPA